MTRQLSEQMSAVARRVSGPPEWIDAPAVQAWHRSDGRTEHDGTPGKPRIWSPDYGTTERWSTPSLRNVHWSDLVDVVPLTAPAGSYTRTAEDWKARAIDAEKERDRLATVLATTARQRDEADKRNARPLTVTDEMVERALDVADRYDGVAINSRIMRVALTAALTEPTEDPEVVALADVLGDFAVADEHNGTRDDMQLARLLHRRGVRAVTEEQP
ncbi:hypothetical protein [Brachybacterium sp.]|uniref:hypothetical protein n=1 Tax=Brachybacterium sp. TaxID=1891286 RepID=UPI002ED3F74E